jgi:nitronate monooxygenase
MRDIGPLSPDAPEFPSASGALAPLKSKAEAAGSGDFSNLWSGQAARLVKKMPAKELTLELAQDALARLASLSG